MSAKPSELQRNFLLVDGGTTVGQVRDRIAPVENFWTYVVVMLPGGIFSVFRLGELIEALKASTSTARPELLLLSLEDVPDLLVPRTAKTVEEADLTVSRVRALFQESPRGRWVVRKAGQVTGVLAAETRSASANVDLGWLNAAEPPHHERSDIAGGRRMPLPQPAFAAPEEEPPLAAGAPAPPSAAPAAAEAPSARRGRARDRITRAGPAPRGLPRVLAAEEGDSEPAPTGDVEPEKRWINAELEGREPKEPLQVGEIYTIAFDVDQESRSSALTAHPLLDQGLFARGEEMVDLTVQLASEDFEVFTEPQKLRVPLRGKSKNKARFDISPKREGSCVLNALFLKNGNFVQLMTLKLQTGRPLGEALSSSKTLGRSLDSSFEMRPRDVTLVFRKTTDGFQAILSSAVYAIATLPITEPQLNQMIGQARETLQGIVDLAVEPGERAVYQEGIDIPPRVNEAALRTVAKAGFRLFQQIFSGPAADAQSKLLGTKLRQLAQRESLKIQILSEKFLLPWGILYMADSFDPDHVDPELFLGFKHIIEHIPLQQGMEVLGSTIDSRPLLNVGVNVNADIDAKMGIPVIADQLKYWQEFSGRGAAKLIVRKTREEVQRALADPGCPDQVLYFYCHAVSKSLSEQGGPDASALVLTGDGRLTLEDLSVSGPTGNTLPGSPLVFINACESAELSPLFYDGFVPFFLSKGARGVVGTECETPALFAAEWARRFFDEFLQGKTLGKVFLDLRREFYERHNNLLGLLYALYCDGDTQIAPAVAKAGGSNADRPDA